MSDQSTPWSSRSLSWPKKWAFNKMLESKLPVIEEEKVDLSQVEDIIIDAKKNLQENIVIMAKPDDDLNRPAEPIN